MVLKLSVVAANRIAGEVTDLVGDGCVIRRIDRRSGIFRPVAVRHRDQRHRKRMEGSIQQRPVPSSASGWAAHALDRNMPVRLRGRQAAEAVGPLFESSSEELEALSAVVAPLRLATGPIGVVIAFRDGRSGYSYAEEQLVEHLARGFEDTEDSEEVEAPVELPPLLEQLPGERLLDHVAAGVWATDLWGITTYVNEAICELLGVPSSTLIGAGIASFVEEPPEEVYGDRPPRSVARDHRLLRHDGSEAWVTITCKGLVDSGGRRLGTVSTLTDATARKRAELDLRLRAAAHDTVGELAALTLSGAPLDRVARAAAEATADLLGAEYAAVCDVDADRRVLVPRAVVGLDPELLGASLPFGEQSVAALALGDHEPFLVSDFEALELLEASDLARELGVRSAVCVAIAGGRGMIGASSPRPNAFAGRDLGFLRSMAGVLSGRWAEARVPGARHHAAVT